MNHQNSFEFKGLYSKKCFLDMFAEKIKEYSQIHKKKSYITIYKNLIKIETNFIEFLKIEIKKS